MVRLDRITTKTGDRGTTRLVGGREIAKDDLRVESYGTVDELNTVLGLARAHARAVPLAAAVRHIDTALLRIQRELFNLGAELATHPDERGRPAMPRVTAADVAALEELGTLLNEALAPLGSFLLPGGGHPFPAALHQARTVCRRAERLVVALLRREPVESEALRYLNRLSDVLFIMARAAAQALGDAEQLWQS